MRLGCACPAAQLTPLLLGKSRCVNALLASLPTGARCAVCVHAFALSYGLETTAIDRERTVLYEEVFDFGGGCVCCSPRGDFLRMLYKIAGERVTHLLVETTGVAEPLVFAKVFYADAFVAERFRLDAVLHVLDGRTLPPTEDTAPWRAAAAAQLAVASLVCVNLHELHAESSADELSPIDKVSETGETQPNERNGPQLGGTVTASVGASIELVSVSAGAATDLAGVVLDATSQFASVTLDGASNVLGGAVSSVSSLATGNVGGSADGLTRIGTASLSAVSNSAGVLVSAATELGTLGIERVGDVGRQALRAAASVTSAALDDVIGLPAHAAHAMGDVGMASYSAAHGMVSAVSAGVMASHGFVSELLNGAAPSAARVIACLQPGDSSAAAGALLWATIATTGAFRPETAVVVDPDFLAPQNPADDLSPLFIPTVQGGHAARVACVCATEVGTPLIEARLQAWLEELAQSGRVIRMKGRVWVRADVADAKPPRLMVVEGLRDKVQFWEKPSSSAVSEAATPLCGATACDVVAHDVSDSSLTSKVFMILEPGENVALIKKAFRECFVPPGYVWAADVDIDFPPRSDQAPHGIERQLQDGGQTVVLWRVGSKFYACEAHCPHAGAPLIDGSVLDMEDAAAARCAARQMHVCLPLLTLRACSTTLGPLLSCQRHFFTWDLASGEAVSALGCGSLTTYEVVVVLRSVYICRTPKSGSVDDPGLDSGFSRRPSWRKAS